MTSSVATRESASNIDWLVQAWQAHFTGGLSPFWQAWRAKRSSECVVPPGMGAPMCGYPPLGEAPSTYVFQT